MADLKMLEINSHISLCKNLKQVARHEETIRRSVLLFLLYLIAPLQAMFHIIDPDIWWHLRTGQWILAHGTVRQQISSQVMAWGKRGLPIARLFEILV